MSRVSEYETVRDHQSGNTKHNFIEYKSKGTCSRLPYIVFITPMVPKFLTRISPTVLYIVDVEVQEDAVTKTGYQIASIDENDNEKKNNLLRPPVKIFFSHRDCS